MNPVLNPSELSRIENLELLAKHAVEGFIIGLHKSPFHGFSVEFAEHRAYNPGEATRYVDWKVFARTDKMFVKKFEEETNLRCQLVLDASSSMYFPEKPEKNHLTKIRFGIMASAAFTYLMRRQRDATGLTIFSDKIEFQSHAKNTLSHQKMLFSKLELLSERLSSEKKTTSAAESLHHVAESIHQRSLVIILSDMMDSAMSDEVEKAKIFEALQHLRHAKHEVILFYIVDKKHELEFEFENRPYIFVDLETGEKVKLRPSEVKEKYASQMQKFRKELELRCGQYGVDLVEADINRDFSQIFIPYLVKRSKLY